MGDCSAAGNVASDRSSVTLRGTSNGFEIQIDSNAPLSNVVDDIHTKLDEAPGFFKGGDVTLRFDASPPNGYIDVIRKIVKEYELRIVGISEIAATARVPSRGIVETVVASGSEPVETADNTPTLSLVDEDVCFAEKLVSRAGHNAAEGPVTVPPIPRSAAPVPLFAVETVESGSLPSKIVIGPVRSGCTLEFSGHLIVMGDINPGAEIRASGSIVVLGRLRGVAHAGCSGTSGFILALQLEPQQLRIGSFVARSGDSEMSPDKAEIAYVKDGGMIVDQYRGRVPFGVETSKF